MKKAGGTTHPRQGTLKTTVARGNQFIEGARITPIFKAQKKVQIILAQPLCIAHIKNVSHADSQTGRRAPDKRNTENEKRPNQPEGIPLQLLLHR